MSRARTIEGLASNLFRQRDMIKESAVHQLDELRHEFGEWDVNEPTEVEEEEVNSNLTELAFDELLRVDRALRRADVGKYGQCESCGERIPLVRLRAIPQTTLCIHCQRKWESIHPPATEPARSLPAGRGFAASDPDTDMHMGELRRKL